MTETIGFIGLGVLGSAVAENLVKAGLGVIAHDISADKLTAFERQGGQAAASPNDVADRSNVVVLCLATVKALHDVVGGKDGLVRGGDDGQIIVAMCGRLRVGKGFLNDIARAGRSCHVFGLLMRRLQMAAGHNALREIGSRS